MEFLIDHPLRQAFENELNSGNLQVAREMLRNDPDLDNYDYSSIMRDALKKGDIQTAEFMINNNLNFSRLHYSYSLIESLERGDFRTADFMIDKNLGLRKLNWKNIAKRYQTNGNQQIAKWFDRNLRRLEDAIHLKNPASRPTFRSRNLNLLFELEDEIIEHNRNGFSYVKPIIKQFPSDLFDTYTARRLKQGNTETLDIIVKARPISENVLQNALEEATEMNNLRMIRWIKKQQTPTPENIQELKRLINNFRFTEADRLLLDEPSLLKADVTDIFEQNLRLDRRNVVEYIKEKKLPYTSNLESNLAFYRASDRFGEILRSIRY